MNEAVDKNKTLDYVVDEDVGNQVPIKKKVHQLNWLKPFEEKLQNILEIVKHPNDNFGIHHFLQKIAQSSEQLFSNFYATIYGITRPNNGYPFPYKLKNN